MDESIYITGCKLIFPGNYSITHLHQTLKKENLNIEFNPLVINNLLLGQLGVLQIDDQNKYYPPRNELKIMREDVLAATICIQELVDEAGLNDKEQLENLNLFIANGSFIENLFDENKKAYKNFKKVYSLADKKERQQEFYRVLPPLLGLNTLTNATESYAAQFTGITGENTTFGNTSMSGYYALKEAVNNINAGNTSIAIVGASTNSNISSFLTHKKYHASSEWKESPGSIFLLLETEKNLRKSRRRKLGKIQDLKHNYIVPNIFGVVDKNKTFNSSSDTLVFSDTFSNSAGKYNNWKNIYSLDNYLGNTGAASVLLNIASALTFLEDYNSVDCIDTDMFKRSSFVKISK